MSGDRVRDPVGTNLPWIVGKHGYPRLHPRLDDYGREPEVAEGHLLQFLGRLRHHRRDGNAGDLPREGKVNQLEELTEQERQFISGSLGIRRRSPLVHEAVLLEHPDEGLGVANIDGQQHQRLSSTIAMLSINLAGPTRAATASRIRPPGSGGPKVSASTAAA